MNQKKKILQYLQQHGKITVKEAIYELGITQGATRITELIEDGHPIERKEWKTVTRSDGTETQVRVYRYKRPQAEQTSMFGEKSRNGIML